MTIDLSEQSVITGRDLERVVHSGAKELILREGVVLTSTAKEIINGRGITVTKVAGNTIKESHSTAPSFYSKGTMSGSPESLFNSREAQTIKEEIVKNGRKLWQREFVDGNGGNISCRISNEYVICTPTLVSKGDLTVEDLCLVDMEGKQVAGKKPRTSEILTHLAIYKTVPKAKACIHAHPPHATAYAITGTVPMNCVIPEEEVFVGQVGITVPYETPGTTTLADQVVLLAKDHNTILLANHGVITWADSITHAEWFMEVVDTYCRTLILASQLGAPITRIPANKTKALMDIKQSLDLPDPRLSGKECTLCDLPESIKGVTVCPRGCKDSSGQSTCTDPSGNCPSCTKGTGTSPASSEVESLIKRITDEVMAALKIKN